MPLNKIRLNFKKKPLNRKRSNTPSSNTPGFGQQFGIIVGTLSLFFLILLGVNILTRASWEQGLRHQTQLVLDRTFPGEYLVKDRATVIPAVDITGATFELFPRQGRPFEQQRLGMILNVATIFGPLPAVFLCEGNRAVRFAGFGFYSATFDAESAVIVNSQIPHLINLIASSLGIPQGGQN